MTATTTLVIAFLGSSVIATLIQCIFTAFRERKKKKDSTRDGIRILLYDRIKSKGRKYIAAQEITTEDLEDLIAMHNIYHGMGGNGFLDKIMSEVKALKLI